jgi:glyceraldehyde-3-phosphate dehydrogenase (NAD(P))
MSQEHRVRVVVNGYAVIGMRVADAITLQGDMELVGVADVTSDYRRAKIDSVWASRSSRSSGSATARGSIEKTSGGIIGPPATRSGR